MISIKITKSRHGIARYSFPSLLFNNKVFIQAKYGFETLVFDFAVDVQLAAHLDDSMIFAGQACTVQYLFARLTDYDLLFVQQVNPNPNL